jgi:3-hydroxybutyryl-CoA dehydrogenase
VAVIGAGPLGRRLAALSCSAGYFTTLEDVLPSNLRTARQELGEEVHPKLQLASSVAEAVRDADLVLDSVPDELESKLEIFQMVDRMAPPHTVLLTPTAIHSIADLASCTYRAERCFAFAVPAGFVAGAGPLGKLRLMETAQSLDEARQLVVAFWARAGWQVKLCVDPAHTPLPTIR